MCLKNLLLVDEIDGCVLPRGTDAVEDARKLGDNLKRAANAVALAVVLTLDGVAARFLGAFGVGWLLG